MGDDILKDTTKIDSGSCVGSAALCKYRQLDVRDTSTRHVQFNRLRYFRPAESIFEGHAYRGLRWCNIEPPSQKIVAALGSRTYRNVEKKESIEPRSCEWCPNTQVIDPRLSTYETHLPDMARQRDNLCLKRSRHA